MIALAQGVRNPADQQFGFTPKQHDPLVLCLHPIDRRDVRTADNALDVELSVPEQGEKLLA